MFGGINTGINVFTSDSMKRYRNDALAHRVTTLIKESVEEKSFADVIKTIATIIPFDYSVPGDAHINFLNVVKTAPPSTYDQLRTWYSLYLNM